MSNQGTYPFGAHGDSVNQTFSIVGVVGTLGTTDAGGTANVLPIGVDPSTGAMYVNNLGAAGGGGSNVNVITGTQQALGTVGTVGTILGIGGTVTVSGASAGTNVQLVNGTLTLGTVVGKDAVGVAATANPFQIAGTDSGGTVRVPLVTAAGAISVSGASAGTFVNIVTGTLQNVGSVVVTAGTISSDTVVGGTLQLGTVVGANATAGTSTTNPLQVGGTTATGTVYGILVDATGVQRSTGSQVMTGGTLTTGTLQNIVSGTLGAVTTVSNLTNGSVTMTVGTLTTGTLQNLVTGTINALAAGTITTGTVSMTTGTLNGGTLTNLNYGTITLDPHPGTVGTYYGTQGTTGAAVWGTLVPGVGAGNKVYVSGLSVVVTSGTVEVAITNNVAGSMGTGVLTRGQYVPGGGIARDYSIARQTGTGGTIAYWLGGAGTVDFILDYWVGA